jgi:hypothetical protein
MNLTAPVVEMNDCTDSGIYNDRWCGLSYVSLLPATNKTSSGCVFTLGLMVKF